MLRLTSQYWDLRCGRVVRSSCYWFALTIASVARAETIWNWTHQASGSVSADVIGGLPAQYAFDITLGPDDPDMRALAYDSTGGGALGGSFGSFAVSQIDTSKENVLALDVELSVAYVPSLFPGGLLPGGQGDGTLSSTIEFTIPSDNVSWYYVLYKSVGYNFQGETSVLVEDVTRSEILAHLTDATNSVETLLTRRMGDLVRVTMNSSGGGAVPPGVLAIGEYDAWMRNVFTVVPEPSVLSILSASFFLTRGRRGDRRSVCDGP